MTGIHISNDAPGKWSDGVVCVAIMATMQGDAFEARFFEEGRHVLEHSPIFVIVNC